MSRSLVPNLEVRRGLRLERLRELPVRGEVLAAVGSKVQAGDVVARAYLPGDLHIVRVAEKLGIEPFEVARGLKVKVGDPITKGQLLCEHAGLFGLFKSRCVAESEGEVEFFMEKTGHIGVREKARPVELKAYVSGQVVKVEPEKSVTVQCYGAFIQGVFGVGGERLGEIKLLPVAPDQVLAPEHVPADAAGKILVGGCRPSLETLQSAAQAGVQGLVTGSIDDYALAGYLGYDLGIALTGDEDVPMTLIVTEGFGLIPIAARVLEVLGSFEGSQASLNGATQVRAGAIRPEVIVCHNDESIMDEDAGGAGSLGFRLGSRVRIVRVPYFGKLGEVVDLPDGVERIESGAMARVLRAKLDEGQVVTVPRANVELV
ncbi:MAG: hypothetical protein GX589_02560 [Deltaproteobacteria bacterium]|nr:hypothetical protein [Deltaproteobacteria bacterium]